MATQPTQPKKQDRNYGVLFALLLLLLVAGGVLFFLLQPAPPPPKVAKDPVPVAPPDAGEVIAAAPDAAPVDSGEGPAQVAMVEKTERTGKTERVGRKIEIPSKTERTAKKPEAADAGQAEETAPDAAPPPDAGGPAAAVEDAGPQIELAEVAILFREELPWLKTVVAEINLDGKNIARVEEKEGMQQNKDIPIFSGSLPVGIHSMNLKLKFIGDSAVFSYLEGYSFTMKHASKFESHSGKSTRAVIIATPKGNMTNDWKDRVALRVEVQ